MLLTNTYQRVNSSSAWRFLEKGPPLPQPQIVHQSTLGTCWSTPPVVLPLPGADVHPAPQTQPGEVDFLYLFSRHIEWLRQEEPSAAWDLLAAAQSSHGDTRSLARTLLATSHPAAGLGQRAASGRVNKQKRSIDLESNMKLQHGLEIVDDGVERTNNYPGFSSGLSLSSLQALNEVSHESNLPAGAILFVEGQSPRGMFILCSGKVNLSTTSREGKILILKTAAAGEALGLSAAILGMGYELTAETATSCQLNFVDRKHLLELMQSDLEVAGRAAHCLSLDFQSAYRDIHDLVLTRSSAGKLARLLLLHSPTLGVEAAETRIHSSMTHEEMAQRIGSSRETVTRLLSDLKKKQLIRLDGPTLVIRDRTALEALAV